MVQNLYIWRVTTDFYCLGVRIWAQRNHIVIIFHSYYLQCVNNNLLHTGNFVFASTSNINNDTKT